MRSFIGVLWTFLCSWIAATAFVGLNREKYKRFLEQMKNHNYVFRLCTPLYAAISPIIIKVLIGGGSVFCAILMFAIIVRVGAPPGISFMTALIWLSISYPFQLIAVYVFYKYAQKQRRNNYQSKMINPGFFLFAEIRVPYYILPLFISLILHTIVLLKF